ncbi:Aspartate/glutamate/uridylate kinase [Cantharellus anzutake]|uniref:Aspartate/glutamate/uridylate kinase n=1 Tax=Cantharellus anzutake TaxID=1750568 RepID=UPI0019063C1A|nr:Aspartate/glutamate/uridylate kinase [Cantharellus anzutake]KAF8343997.1 Aspartate/glutamate/uridylate kinase [Cantharellus anzutake]
MPPKAKPSSKTVLTVVIKLGTSSIVHEITHQPLLSTLSSIVETVIRLRGAGHKVVLVSSGAIGVGLKRMELPARPKSLSGKQALAAIGQGRLIALWDNLFSQLGQPIAQVLLTRGDLSDRTRYLNAVNTLTELLTMGVVPIINENDTISVSEIRFGDNDTLSAIAASMIHADYLFLLTDVDSLYTSNPRKDPDARAIDVVSSVHEIRSQVSTATLGSKLGTGGMETKLIAAEIATGAGVATVITSSRHPENIFGIIEYIAAAAAAAATHWSPSHLLLRQSNSGTSTPDSCSSGGGGGGGSGTETPPSMHSTWNNAAQPKKKSKSKSKSNSDSTRPPHTLFVPSVLPLKDLKQWTSYTLTPSGSVIIDEGAHRHLSKREAGGRLLSVGVVGVEGVFASGQAVRIVVRRKKQQQDSSSSRSESESENENESERVDRKSPFKLVVDQRNNIEEESGSSNANTPSPPPITQPNTPVLLPQSLTSSISSIDPLSRSTSLTSPTGSSSTTISSSSSSTTTHQQHWHHHHHHHHSYIHPTATTTPVIDVPPAIPEMVEEESWSSVTFSNNNNNKNPSTTSLTKLSLEEKNKAEKDGWEDVEVGRGLANYNALEIQKIRGKKSSDVARVLGYADSEYVVENITIRDAYKLR